MTDRDLQRLLDTRDKALIAGRDKSSIPYGAMDPLERAASEAISIAFHAADRAIVAELVRRNRPACLGSVELWLTRDRT